MFHIRDDEKDLHEAAIDKLLEAVVDSGIGSKLARLKGKPVAASMTVEKVPPEMADKLDDAMDSMDDMDEDPGGDGFQHDDDDEEEPSDEEKAEIERKFRKFCKGGEI